MKTKTTLTVSVTLNRAHKIVERLNKLAATYQADGVRYLTPIDCKVMTREIASKEIAENAKRGTNALMRFRKILNVTNDIKNVIKKANAQLGINEKLTQSDSLARENDLISKIIQENQGLTYELEDIDQIRANTDVQDGERSLLAIRRSSNQHIPVRVMDAQFFDLLEEERRAIGALISKTADDVSELNSNKVTFEMEASLAQEIGIS